MLPMVNLSIADVLIPALFFFALRLSAASTDDLTRLLGDAVRDTLAALHITEKDAADRAGTDVANFRNRMYGVNGLQLSLVQLARIGVTCPTFWIQLWLRVVYIVVAEHTRQIVEDVTEWKHSA